MDLYKIKVAEYYERGIGTYIDRYTYRDLIFKSKIEANEIADKLLRLEKYNEVIFEEVKNKLAGYKIIYDINKELDNEIKENSKGTTIYLKL